MLNCKQTTKLVSESLDRELSIAERVELWSHLLICSFCRLFRKDTLAIRELIRKTSNDQPPTPVPTVAEVPPEARLPPTAKARLQAMIVANAIDPHD